jgi:hypothetical protein
MPVEEFLPGIQLHADLKSDGYVHFVHTEPLTLEDAQTMMQFLAERIKIVQDLGLSLIIISELKDLALQGTKSMMDLAHALFLPGVEIYLISNNPVVETYTEILEDKAGGTHPVNMSMSSAKEAIAATAEKVAQIKTSLNSVQTEAVH